MEGVFNLTNMAIAAASSLMTFLTLLVTKKERKSDLEQRLFDRVEELTLKILELNIKYVQMSEELEKLRCENDKLRKLVVNKIEGREQ